MDTQKQVLPFTYKEVDPNTEHFADVSSYLSAVKRELETGQQVFYVSRKSGNKRKFDEVDQEQELEGGKKQNVNARSVRHQYQDAGIELDYGDENGGDTIKSEKPVANEEDAQGGESSATYKEEELNKERLAYKEEFQAWQMQFVEDFKIQKQYFNDDFEVMDEEPLQETIEDQQNEESQSHDFVDAESNRNTGSSKSQTDNENEQKISELPTSNDTQSNPEAFAKDDPANYVPPRLPNNFTNWRTFMITNPPTKLLLQSIPHHTIIRLLSYMKKLITKHKSMKGQLSQWPVALMLRVSSVLEYDQVFELRELSKRMLTLRKNLKKDDETRIICEMIVVIVYEIYGQKDLYIEF